MAILKFKSSQNSSAGQTEKLLTQRMKVERLNVEVQKKRENMQEREMWNVSKRLNAKKEIKNREGV